MNPQEKNYIGGYRKIYLSSYLKPLLSNLEYTMAKEENLGPGKASSASLSRGFPRRNESFRVSREGR